MKKDSPKKKRETPEKNSIKKWSEQENIIEGSIQGYKYVRSGTTTSGRTGLGIGRSIYLRELK
jgi:hypothetical protein